MGDFMPAFRVYIQVGDERIPRPAARRPFATYAEAVRIAEAYDRDLRAHSGVGFKVFIRNDDGDVVWSREVIIQEEP